MVAAKFTGSRAARMTIGELSAATACNVETVRYYERIGLLPHPARSAAGRRNYGPDDVRRLRFVRRARGLGFPLNEVRTLLTLAEKPATCATVRGIAEQLVADIAVRQRSLHSMASALRELIGRCSQGRVTGCPIVEALSGEVNEASPETYTFEVL